MEVIYTSDTQNAEMAHEEAAILSEQKWHEICKKLRAEGVIK